MSKRKKVHFADSIGTKENDCKLDAPSIKRRRSKPLNFDDRKTSEYKYFRELQEKISHDPQSSQVTKKDCDRRILKPSETRKESVYPIHSEYNKNEDLPALSIIPIAQRSPLQTSRDSWNSAFNCETTGIFSDKRCKLVALISKTYSLEMNELIHNRSDIISKALKRLRIVKEPSRELEDLPEIEIKFSDDRYRLTNLPQDVSFNWCNDLENTEHVAHATRTGLCKYSLSNGFNEADEHERFKLACSEVQTFPDSLEDDLLNRSECNWKLDGKDSPEQCASWICTSLAKWIPDDIEDVTEKVLESSEESIPNYYSSCHSTDQLLVPYTKSRCLDICCFNEHEECSMFPLPISVWNANSVKGQSRSTSDNLVRFEIDHFLPALHAASNVRGQNSAYGWWNIFSSQLSKNCQSLVISSPKLRRNLEHPHKCLPMNLDWGRLSATCVDCQPSKDKIENSEAFSAYASKCDGCIDDVIQTAYFSSPSFGSWALDFGG